MKLTSYQKGQLELVAISIAVFVVVGVLAYGAWYFGRQINYNLSYKDMVQETICETVKPNQLIDPRVCNEH